MKDLMSVVIAVVFTLLVVPAIVDVSVGAQELSIFLDELIQDDEETVIAIAELGVEVNFEDSDPVPEIVIRCRDRDVCTNLALQAEAQGFDCTVNIFGTTVCRR